MFQLGQNVKWQTSPAHKRIGKVVFVVPAGQSPNYLKTYKGTDLEIFLDKNLWSTGRCESALSDGHFRNHESYIIEVSPAPGKVKPILYWPRVKNLELATAADI